MRLAEGIKAAGEAIIAFKQNATAVSILVSGVEVSS